MRNLLRLGIDLAWVGLTALLAQLIRDNFVPSLTRLDAIAPYALISVASAALVFTAARLNRTVWRYTSLLDALHLVAAVTIALLLALLAGFALNRLENVARSVPVIQWLLLVGALIGTRVLVRLSQERSDKSRKQLQAPARREHTIVVGVNDLTELYLASIAQFASANLGVVGILSRGRSLHGRLMRQYKILGAPEDVSRILEQMTVHGVTVDRIVVTQPFEELSKAAQDALLGVERSTAIKVEWLMETLGWSRARPAVAPNLNADPENGDESLFELKDGASLSRRRYAFAKRATDVAAAAGLLIALGPLVMLISLLIVIEIGLPVVFWQQRPGRYGRPFKLYKFRTMLPAHDRDGKRIPDELRSSRVGGFLRRSRLDELPQLYNILVGEMSLVGPRPLLPIDQPQTHAIRLLARPGLTGWAQINGGREISNEDKAALDIWYIVHSSMWLDTKILLRTIGITVSGDRVNTLAVEAAHFGLEELRRKATGEAADRAPVSCKPIAADEAA